MAVPRFSLKQIGYFLAIAEAGSFRAASERLNIAQTALAQALTDLEQELDVRLVARHRSIGVTLTAAGMRFLGEARFVLEAADGLYSAARGWEQNPNGRLAIGCYTTMAPLLIPQLFATFKHLHPAVELDLIEGSSDQLCAGLRTGVCELALLYEFGLDEDTARDPLYNLHPHLVVHEGHRLAKQEEIDLRDIVHEPFILFDMAPSVSNILEVFAQVGLQPKIAYRTSGFELARALAANGLGYTMLLQKPASQTSYDGSRVITRPIFGVRKHYSVVLAWAKSIRLTRRALAFRSFCQSRFLEK